MDLKCRCNQECIKPPADVLEKLESAYYPCRNCPELRLKKFKPLLEQLDPNQKIDAKWEKCTCGRRHLDVVVAHILTIMQKEGVKDENSKLRDACVPLITPAYPLKTAPYLSEDSLVILSFDVNKECAEKILEEVPEVKGILKGDIKETVGIKNSKSSPHVYELLAGCDMRSDLVQTPFGPILIYKHQGEIHIEFPKPVSPKITLLNAAIEKYEDPKILDCTCGPGTLGIAALKGGAKRVVFNDLWYPAAHTTALNLEVNGFPVELSGQKQGLIASGKFGDVYCLDVKELGSILKDRFDICLVDTFPGVDTNEFSEAINSLCQEIVII
jgi:2-polyprenyl-3-methyl-5-hydroxy-6-metoxy-1,4-benzoquinol methylase